MANIDKTGTGPTLGQIPFSGKDKVFVLSNTVDLTGDPVVQGDVIQSLAVPAGTQVISTHYKSLIPAVGTTLTMNIGDGGSTAGWMASVDGKSAAGVFDHSTIGTDARAAAGPGYNYDAGDSIDIVMTVATAITAGPKFTITAVCADLN